MSEFLFKAVLTIAIVFGICAILYVIQQFRDGLVDRVAAIFLGTAVVGVVLLISILAMASARAHDDGRYAGSPLKSWFDHLASKKGLCCSFADGVSVEDPDWRTAGAHYSVRLDGRWIEVPDEAVITEPNQLGKTMVWPMGTGVDITIRCFMPGSMT